MSLLNTVSYIWNHPIASRERVAAFRRILHWQLSSRLTMEKIVYPWIESSSFVVRRGEAGLTANIYTGLHEFDEMGFALHVLRPEDLFFDVGANLGEYTILGCAVAGARGICFEPVPATFKRLELNLVVNELMHSVRSINCAVGREEGNVLFTTDLDTTNHAIIGTAAGTPTIQVPVKTLDSFCESDFPFLLKIDVEGFEMPVLQGATKLLQNDQLQAIIIEMNGAGKRYGFEDSEIDSVLISYGFSHVRYSAYDRTLELADGATHTRDNRLYVRNLDIVRERVATARKFRIGSVDL